MSGAGRPGRPGPRGARRRRVVLALSVPFLAALGAALPGPGATPVAAQTPGDTVRVAVPGTDVSILLAWIPAGSFRMGSPDREPGRDVDEGPVHEVELAAFRITVHEITQAQYAPYRFENFDSDAGPDGPGSFDVDAVTRPSPPYEDPGHGMGGPDHPTAGMTRLNALHYARWLSMKTGRLFRLPTEAEWEYACRAGGDGAWGGVATADGLAEVAWLAGNATGSHHPVGTRAPNAWGVHDLHGNVAEWVVDGYDAEAYAGRGGDAPVAAPREGEPTRGRGVVRGGAFDDAPAEARCAARMPEAAAWKRRDPQIPKSRWWNTDSPHVGFRLVEEPGERTRDELRAWWEAVLGG